MKHKGQKSYAASILDFSLQEGETIDKNSLLVKDAYLTYYTVDFVHYIRGL